MWQLSAQVCASHRNRHAELQPRIGKLYSEWEVGIKGGVSGRLRVGGGRNTTEAPAEIRVKLKVAANI